MFIDLIDMELAAKLERVRAYRPGETITQIVSVVDLCLVRDRYAHHEGWKGDVLHAFKLGRLNNDAGRARASSEALRSQADAETTLRLAMMFALRR